jgi:hypothetical protein
MGPCCRNFSLASKTRRMRVVYQSDIYIFSHRKSLPSTECYDTLRACQAGGWIPEANPSFGFVVIGNGNGPAIVAIAADRQFSASARLLSRSSALRCALNVLGVRELY